MGYVGIIFTHCVKYLVKKRKTKPDGAAFVRQQVLQEKSLCIYMFLEIGTRKEKHLQCVSDSLPVKHQKICIFTDSPQHNCRGECRPQAELKSTGSAEATQHYQVKQIFKFPYVPYLMVLVPSSL